MSSSTPQSNSSAPIFAFFAKLCCLTLLLFLLQWNLWHSVVMAGMYDYQGMPIYDTVEPFDYSALLVIGKLLNGTQRNSKGGNKTKPTNVSTSVFDYPQFDFKGLFPFSHFYDDDEDEDSEANITNTPRPGTEATTVKPKGGGAKPTKKKKPKKPKNRIVNHDDHFELYQLVGMEEEEQEDLTTESFLRSSYGSIYDFDDTSTDEQQQRPILSMRSADNYNLNPFQQIRHWLQPKNEI